MLLPFPKVVDLQQYIRYGPPTHTNTINKFKNQKPLLTKNMGSSAIFLI